MQTYLAFISFINLLFIPKLHGPSQRNLSSTAHCTSSVHPLCLPADFFPLSSSLSLTGLFLFFPLSEAHDPTICDDLKILFGISKRDFSSPPCESERQCGIRFKSQLGTCMTLRFVLPSIGA